MKKDINYYMALPYTKKMKRHDDESGSYFVIEIEELPGCSSTGDTVDEALKSINEAIECHLMSMLKDNDVIPEPLSDESFSGRFMLRLPKSLHRELTYKAKKEGVSLNQYALYKLSS